MALEEIRDELVDVLKTLLLGQEAPVALVVLGADGALWAEVYRRLALPQVVLVGVARDEQASNDLSKNLGETPHHIILSCDMNPHEIDVALKTLKLDPSRALYITQFLGPQATLAVAQSVHTKYGVLALEAHRVDKGTDLLTPEWFQRYTASDGVDLIEAPAWLMLAAASRLFPKKQCSRHYPQNQPYTQVSIHYFEKRPYLIRQPNLNDIDALVQLEKACWPDQLQITKQNLLKRIEHFPSGSCVMENEEGLLGVVYSQRILDDKPLLSTNFHDVESLHNPEGHIAQLLAINIPSTNEYVGHGDELLEFMLQLAATTQGIERVVGVTRCKDYSKHQQTPFPDYIKLKDDRGLPVDSVLKLHHLHGGQIVADIAGYRPEDLENKTYGVLIRYDVMNLQCMKPEKKASSRHDEAITHERIKELIDGAIKAIMGPEKAKNYSPETPLMDLGLESLDLLDLRARLQDTLQTEIHPTFFFQHGTGRAVVDYLVESLVNKYCDWLYNVEWDELSIPLQEQNRHKEPGVVLVFLDDSGWGQALAKKLVTYGFSLVSVKVGTSFTQVNPAEFIINPHEALDYQALFQQPCFSTGINQIIYLWGLFNAIPDEPTLTTLYSLHELSCIGLLNTVKSVVHLNSPRAPKLYVLSWGLQKEGNSMSLAQWPMTGLCKAINAEHPDLQLRRISLDREESNRLTVDSFFLELYATDNEDQITWREGKRLAPRLIRVEFPNIETEPFQAQATYIVTGGLGGLGLEFVKWYVDRGAKHLVIFDNESMSPQAQAVIDALISQDISIRVFELCELANREQMAGYFADIAHSLPPIKGVMHTAGLIDDDLLINMDWTRFTPIFDLKVGGAWVLHQLTRNTPLDHFILFSSVGSTMGPLWRANRASANSFLDALSYYRQSHGLAALTVNWAPWDHDGLSVTRALERQVPAGMKKLKAKEGMQVLDRLLDLPIPEVVVAPINWREYLLSQAVDRPLFANMAAECGLKKSEIVRKFHQSREEERPDVLKRYIRGLIRRVLLLSPTAKLDDERLFSDLGLDNRSLAELRNIMQHDIDADVAFPFEILSANPSIEQTAKALYPLILATQKSEQSTQLGNERLKALDEPIAIIGMSCRFPGGANSPERYWELLHNGIDAITEVPGSRWDIDAYYDPDKEVHGKMYTRFGGFIDHVDLFDPQFFGISPREAQDMDPQQRISLEVTWEALENAGIAAHTLKGSKTGVFMGICFNDYGQLIRQSGDVSAVDNYYSTGNHYSVAAGRISYILGLEGPAMAIDTACSSSLVSIDNAVKHLHLGQCNLAIAGGVNLILAPESTINFCKSGMLAEDGRCKTFDAKANGYVRSEGCGILILKRLSDAIKDKDRILAVIHATAINQDGASTGLTVPNQTAQEHVIEEALKQANLKGEDIKYVEAHGTGTSLGDPIEVRAIAATYGAQRNTDNPLIIGSAKTNMGHTEAAAGVAGLIKCVLALINEEIPQHLHFHSLNPYIDIDPESIQIAQTATAWQAGDTPRYAAISSFGFSGTNSHAIIGEAPKLNASDAEQPPYVLTFSAKTPEALSAQMHQLNAFLETHPQVNLSDLCYTLQLGREHFTYRQVIIGSTRKELLERLLTPIDGPIPEDLNTLVTKWLKGEAVAWDECYTHQTRQKISLPTYPFQRERYWAKTAIKSRERSTHATASLHPILSEQQHLPKGLTHLSGAVDLSTQAMYKDHQVYEHIIFPGMGFIELMAVGAKALEATSYSLEQVSIETPLLLTSQNAALVSVLVSPEGEDYQIQVDSEHLEHNQKASQWLRHATAKLCLNLKPQDPIDIKAWQAQCPKTLSTQATYANVSQAGLHYGQAFQGLTDIQVGLQTALGTIDVSSQEHTYQLHPALMDCALQLLMVLLQEQQNEHAQNGVFLPIAFEAINVYKTQCSKAIAYLHLNELSDQHMATADITLCDEAGQVLVELKGYQAKHVEALAFQHILDTKYASDDLYYAIQWQDDSAAAEHLIKEHRQVVMYGTDKPLLKSIEKTLKANQIKTQIITNIHDITHHQQCTDILFLGNTKGLEATHELLNTVHLLTQEFTQHLPQLWIITEGAHAIHHDANPFQMPLIGLGRTLINEHPELHSRLIDLEPTKHHAAEDLLHALNNANSENQIAYRDHRRLVARLHADALAEQQLPPHYHLDIAPKGLLTNLKIKSKAPRPPEPHEVHIQVHATGLNFRDVLNAMDLYPGNPGPLGLECAGIITAIGQDVRRFAIGDEVMALSWDSFADLVTVNEALVSIKPKHMSFADAASIPLVFQTAYYCLITLGQLKKGDTVLIHAASGGIGDAAIQIAQHIGAEIYATASPGKWDFVTGKGVQHVYNSRTLDFADSLLTDTQGVGVDLVINALNGEFIEQTVRCIKTKGSFIEIGKRDIWTPEHMNTARPDINYHIVAIDGLMEQSPATIHELWAGLEPLFQTKKLSPLPITEFSITDAIAAFRYMQASKHIGKVVLTTQIIKAKKELCHAQASYLITAGLGGLGLELAKWLVGQGARHLVLTTRRDPSTEQQLQLDQMKQLGATIYIQPTDLRFKKEVDALFHFIQDNTPPLKGVFHTAGVVDDGIIQQQTWPRFEAVFAPKVDGSWALHEATKDMDLDYFVMFSSIVAVFGLAGQSNYAAANAFMDGLCAHRRSTGLAGLSINWGPWGEVGMAVRQQMNIQGMRSLSLKQGFIALHKALNSNLSQVIVAPMNWEVYLKAHVKESPLFSELSKKTTQKTDQTQRIALKDKLTALPEDEREAALQDYLSKHVRDVLNLKESQLLEPHRGFFDVGMDSLMAVELKNKLQQDLGSEHVLMPTLIFNYSSLTAMLGYYKENIFKNIFQISNQSINNEEKYSNKVAEEKASTRIKNMLADDIDRLLDEDI